MTLKLYRPYIAAPLCVLLLPAACDIDGGGDGDGDGDGDDNSTEPNGSSDSDGVSCDDVGESSRTFSMQYGNGIISVENSDKTYIIHTNWWYLFDGQSVEQDGLSFVVRNPNEVDVGNIGYPAGYPSIYIGSYSGHQSTESNLPIKVSDIESAPTIFETNGTEGGIADKNAAYDVWFTADGDPLPQSQYSPGDGGAYLMVWTFDPDNRQPRGSKAYADHTVEGVDGTWDVWIDRDRSTPPCISYVRTEPVDDLAFDLNGFIRDSVENEYGITDDMYLSVVFAGFEIWADGDGLTLEKFCAEVN
jgi:hypothetical protein